MSIDVSHYTYLMAESIYTISYLDKLRKLFYRTLILG